MLTGGRCVARDVNFVDILFAVFTRSAWECWKSHIDTDINRMGWGYDITFKRLCHANVGILDSQIAVHPDVSTIGGRLYDETTAVSQMKDWLRHTRHDKSEGRTLRCRQGRHVQGM